MPRFSPPSPDYERSFADRLAEMLYSASDSVGTFGKYLDSADSREEERQNKLLQRLFQLKSLEPKPPEPFTLGVDQTRHGPDGSVIARGPERPTGEPGLIPGSPHGLFNKLTGANVVPPEAKEPKLPQPIAGSPHGLYQSGPGGLTELLPPQPKEPKEAKPFWSGKSTLEMRAMLSDPGVPPEQKAVIQKAVADQEAAELKRSRETGAIAAGNQEAGDLRRDTLERGQKADSAGQDLASAQRIIDRMQAIVPKVNQPGMAGRVEGLTVQKGKEYLQVNPDINELAALGEGYVSVIAKIVQRQSGILSNQDLTRAEKSVPQVADNLEVAQRKLEVLSGILTQAQQNLERMRQGSGGRMNPAGTGAQSITPDMARQELKRRGIIK